MAFYNGLVTPGPDRDQGDFVLFTEKQTRCSQNLPSTLPFSPPTSAMGNNYSFYETFFSTPDFSYPHGYGQQHWDAQLASQDLRYFHQHSHNGSSSGSPARSASHASEYNPPTLSASSESGTSLKSTTSSAVASPSIRSVNNNQPGVWTQLHHGSEFHPPILQNQYYFDEALSTNNTEFGTVVVQDNVPNCIGMPAAPLQSPSLPLPYMRSHAIIQFLTLHSLRLIPQSAVNINCTALTRSFRSSSRSPVRKSSYSRGSLLSGRQYSFSIIGTGLPPGNIPSVIY